MAYTVAIFLINRAYGGPEEGGWWYNHGEPSAEYAQYVRGFETESDADKYAAELQTNIVTTLNFGRRSINSVLSTGIYEARVCEGLPSAFPTEKPYYY